PPRGTVALVSAACAGLPAASDLSKLGFGVTVYDALDQAGGTPLAGVPPFRLPREVIDRDIAGIVNENVELRLSTYVGRDVSLRELHDKNDAVLIAAGCFEPNYIGIPGEETEGVMAGIVFLERAYRGRPVEVGTRVILLGSGYTAIRTRRDAAAPSPYPGPSSRSRATPFCSRSGRRPRRAGFRRSSPSSA